MKLKDQSRSPNVEEALNINPVNRKGKGSKTVTSELKGHRWNHGVFVNRVGKKDNERYTKEVIMGGMKEASDAVKDFMRGKKDREFGPDSVLTDFLKKKMKK